MVTPAVPALAAIRFGDDDAIDTLLTRVASTVERSGRRVAGYVQIDGHRGDACCPPIMLRSLATGEDLLLSQNLGTGSRGCRLDYGALQAAAARLQVDIGPETALLLTNRFGKGETDGKGFRDAIGKAVDLSIPVLTAVRDNYLDGWRAFSGDLGIELPFDEDAVFAWLAAQGLVAAKVQRIGASRQSAAKIDRTATASTAAIA